MRPEAEASTEQYIQSIVRFLRRHGRLANRLFVLIAISVVAIKKWFPDLFSWFSHDIVPVLTIVLIGVLMDLILQIEQELHESPLKMHKSEVEAYKHLSQLVREHGVRQVDLIQFSGQTVIPFLQDLAESGYTVSVRMLLMHPEVARKFDTDGKENQLARIDATLGKLRVLTEGNSNFSSEAFFYKTPPGVCCVILDEKIVSAGWYRCFMDGKSPAVMRVRSHTVPTITTVDHGPMIAALRHQFDSLLEHAESTDNWHSPVAGITTGAG